MPDPIEKDSVIQPAGLVTKVDAAFATVVYFYIIALVMTFLVNSIFVLEVRLPQLGLTDFQSNCVYVLLLFVVPFLCVCIEGACSGATSGMRGRRIRFGDADGRPISWGRCFARIAMGLILFPLIPVSFRLALRDENRRTIPDRICKTVVWKTIPDEHKLAGYSSSGEIAVADLAQKFWATFKSAVPVTGFILAIFLLHGQLDLPQDTIPIKWERVFFALVIFLVPSLWFVFTGAGFRATSGMRVRGIRFGDSNGRPISKRRCAVRIAIGIILLPLFPISWVMGLLDARNRTLPDRICGMAVWFGSPFAKEDSQIEKVDSQMDAGIQPAIFVRKIEASGITALLVFIYCLFENIIGFWIALNTVLRDSNLLAGWLCDVLTGLVVYGLPTLLFVTNGAFSRATVGMRARGIRFGDLDGGLLGWRRCAQRIAIGIVCLPLFLVSWVMALMDEKRRTLADRICGTAVCIDSDQPGDGTKD